MFVDEVDIHVQAGDGGNGCMAFRREMRVPRGGPSGGDGGHGGSIYLVASPHQNTLVAYRFHPLFKAQRGQHGMGSNCTGWTGEDLELEVPPGTVVYESGPEGLLKLADLADVGLVGFPNAGKSTLIARVSAARPKIADYPFTTLTPNLGVVSLSGDRSFVVADVPGLIEGAHEGHGLGTKFLAHLERTKVLVHVIDVSSMTDRDPVEDFEIICRELERFTGTDDGLPPLAGKRRVAAANKIDALDDPERLSRLQAHMDRLGIKLYPLSAATGQGVPALVEAMWQQISAPESDTDR